MILVTVEGFRDLVTSIKTTIVQLVSKSQFLGSSKEQRVYALVFTRALSPICLSQGDRLELWLKLEEYANVSCIRFCQLPEDTD